jgi:hypothetical protein
VKAWLFKLIRPLFVRDLDPNEDFSCGQCGATVLRRRLFCSNVCYFEWDSTQQWDVINELREKIK